ncbi:hypothetical protein THAOC_29796, partial [Thalassiosira oceanica]
RQRSRNSLNTSDTTQRHGLNERHQLPGIDQVYISFPQNTPSSHIDSLQADGRSENRNANRDARQNRRGLLQNLGDRITDYFSPSRRQDSETNVSQNSEQNAVDDGSTSSRSPPSDGDGSPEESKMQTINCLGPLYATRTKGISSGEQYYITPVLADMSVLWMDVTLQQTPHNQSK